MKYIHVYALSLMFVVCVSCNGQRNIEPSKDHIKSINAETERKGAIIQNSLPKGGVAINGKKGYTDPTGISHGFGIFWTRIINETATPLELTISFPQDSFAISSAPNSYFKLLLPPDTMTLEKQSLYNYGYKTSDVRSFLDTSFNKPSFLRRTINPKEECLLYVMMLIHLPDNGAIRTGFVLKEEDLLYKVSIAGQLDSASFLCGKIVFRK
ncbi:MAG: hypothetical protein WKF66_16395 [Pedobacter sp.]